MIRFNLVCLSYWIFVDYIFVRFNLYGGFAFLNCNHVYILVYIRSDRDFI